MSLGEIEEIIRAAGSDDLATFGGAFEGGIHCQQIPDELGPCILAIMETGETIQSYLEIGVAAGGTAFLMHHFFQPERIVLVDDNKHHKAGLRKTILKDVPRVEIIGASQDEAVLVSLGKMPAFDVILIDGDHHYPGVKLDTIFYVPMLRPGGFLILHDSALPDWGVARVVRELKADPGVRFIGEYLSRSHTRALGLAVFQKVAA